MAGKTRRPNRLASGTTDHSYTETVEEYNARLARDKWIGLVMGIIGATVLVLNFILEIQNDLPLLPGGHSELYFVGSLVLLGAAAWLRYDLGLTRGQRR